MPSHPLAAITMSVFAVRSTRERALIWHHLQDFGRIAPRVYFVVHKWG